jgi:hypothetical protein
VFDLRETNTFMANFSKENTQKLIKNPDLIVKKSYTCRLVINSLSDQNGWTVKRYLLQLRDGRNIKIQYLYLYDRQEI